MFVFVIAVFLAARLNDVPLLESLYADNPNIVTETEEDGVTALHYASQYERRFDAAQWLINHGNWIWKWVFFGLLYLFCLFFHHFFLAIIRYKGAKIEAEQDKTGHTPLHWAAIGGNTKMCFLLVLKGELNKFLLFFCNVWFRSFLFHVSNETNIPIIQQYLRSY